MFSCSLINTFVVATSGFGISWRFGVESGDNRFSERQGPQQGTESALQSIFYCRADPCGLEISCNSRRSPGSSWRCATVVSSCFFCTCRFWGTLKHGVYLNYFPICSRSLHIPSLYCQMLSSSLVEIARVLCVDFSAAYCSHFRLSVCSSSDVAHPISLNFNNIMGLVVVL